jgi:hypothetical protein
MFQIGDHFSKLILYNYGKIIDSTNQTKQDMTAKIVNTEIVIPKEVLKSLFGIIYYIFEVKDGLLNSI